MNIITEIVVDNNYSYFLEDSNMNNEQDILFPMQTLC